MTYNHRKYNHLINPDLFSYIIGQTWRIGYDKTVELAKGLWGKFSYNKVTCILKNYDLKIEEKQFYNLIYVKANQKLKLDKELNLLFPTLNYKDFKVCVNDIY